eukprot:TRINITY_DN15536_c0_g1_i1.p1 TRINITY_DN15536_c0_g1~~TRINITY_DN15536_c0_g1_i1.p1  ORF type:complete len:332 (+),score=93.21 TRINITY_DN15536_c0_g1_i1:7-1002(+)
MDDRKLLDAQEAGQEQPTLAGKYCIVNAGNKGIGLSIVRACLMQGAHVVLACRSEANGQEALQRLEDEKIDTTGSVQFMAMDMASFKSIREFVAKYLEKNIPLHYLFNNAGIGGQSGTNLEPTEDGFERVWQVNYLGQFLLVQLLWDLMEKSAPARIINVASSMHELVNRETMLAYNRYRREIDENRYAISKLAQIIMSYEIQRRYSREKRVYSVSMHPGAVDTDMWNWVKFVPLRRCLGSMYLTAGQAANIAIAAALLPENMLAGNLIYYAPQKDYIPNWHMANDVFRILFCARPGAYQVNSTPLSRDEELGRILWDASQEMIHTQSELH